MNFPYPRGRPRRTRITKLCSSACAPTVVMALRSSLARPTYFVNLSPESTLRMHSSFIYSAGREVVASSNKTRRLPHASFLGPTVHHQCQKVGLRVHRHNIRERRHDLPAPLGDGLSPVSPIARIASTAAFAAAAAAGSSADGETCIWSGAKTGRGVTTATQTSLSFRYVRQQVAEEMKFSCSMSN